MTNNPFVPPLRAHVEAWEREAADQWQAIIRSPHILNRLGTQINRTLESQQHVRDVLAQSSQDDTPATYHTVTHMLYLLERVEAELDALSTRIDRLENMLSR